MINQENLAQAAARFLTLIAERDAAARERDEAEALAKERGGELTLCWCVATDSSPDDAPDPFPAGMAYKAVDAMQDREYAAEARALKAEAERDAAQQMVVEMRAALIIGRDIVIETSSNNRHNKFVEYAYDVIEASAHVAGRWCLASERDAAIARAETSDAAARALGDDFTRVLRECADAIKERDAAIASLTIQRDAAEEGATAAVQMRNDALARAHAAEALARERTNQRDNYGQELDKSTGMVEMYVDDATAARLLWRQSEAACAKMHAERDAAQQMVTEMRAILLDRAREQAAKARGEVSGLSGRWCLTSERDEALAILQDLVTLQDSPSDRYQIDESTESINFRVDDLIRMKLVQYLDAMDRARKLVGGAQ
jgi:hypothetical protein